MKKYIYLNVKKGETSLHLNSISVPFAMLLRDFTERFDDWQLSIREEKGEKYHTTNEKRENYLINNKGK